MNENDYKWEKIKERMNRENFLLSLAEGIIDIVNENRYLRQRNEELEEIVDKHNKWVSQQIETNNNITSNIIHHLLNGDISLNK